MNKNQRIKVSQTQLRHMISRILSEGIEETNVLYSYDGAVLKERSAEVLKILNLLFFGLIDNPNRLSQEKKIVELSYRDMIADLDNGLLQGSALSNAISVVLANRKGPTITVPVKDGDPQSVSIDDYVTNLNAIVLDLTAKSPGIDSVYESLKIIMGGRPLDYVAPATDPNVQAPTFRAYGADAQLDFDPTSGKMVPVGEPTQVVNVKESIDALIDQGEVRQQMVGFYQEFVGQSVKPLADKADLIRDIMIGIRGAPNYLNAQDLYDIGKLLESAWDTDVQLGYAGVSSNVVGSYAVTATANSIYEKSSSEETQEVTLPLMFGLAGAVIMQNSRLFNIANIPVKSVGLEMKVRLNNNRLRRDRVAIKDFFGEDDPLYVEVIKAEQDLRDIQTKIDEANTEAESLLGILRTSTGVASDAPDADIFAAQLARSEAFASSTDTAKNYGEAEAAFRAFRNKRFAEFDEEMNAFRSARPVKSRKGAPARLPAQPVRPTEADILADFSQRYPEYNAIITGAKPAAVRSGESQEIERAAAAAEKLRTARGKEAAARAEFAAKRTELDTPDKQELKTMLDGIRQDNKELMSSILERNRILEQLKTRGYINDRTKSAFQKYWMNFSSRLGTGGNLAHYLAWTTSMMMLFTGVRALLVERAKLDATERLIETKIIQGFDAASSGGAPAPEATDNHIADFADDWAEEAAWYDLTSFSAKVSKYTLRGAGEEELTKLALQIAIVATKSLTLNAEPNDIANLRDLLAKAKPFVNVKVEKEGASK